jgi:uncharacterized membrane protein
MFKRRSVKEWLGEPGTQSGLATVATLVGAYFGLSDQLVLSILGVVSAISMARRG